MVYLVGLFCYQVESKSYGTVYKDLDLSSSIFSLCSNLQTVTRFYCNMQPLIFYLNFFYKLYFFFFIFYQYISVDGALVIL